MGSIDLRSCPGYGETMEIFLAAPPGLEPVLAEEAAEAGFAGATAVPGGVTVSGGWPEVWRANLTLRGAGRVLARVASFRALHLAQLDKRARKVDWGFLPPDVAVTVEAVCRGSRIYHGRAAAERVARATGRPEGPDGVTLMVRIEDDLCTISVDTSDEPLHRRGHKEAVGKAPLRETLAALFLRQCGYRGDETVVDPMCGSGTFVLEAAEIAAGLLPGRSRRFAFERLATFDPDACAAMQSPGAAPAVRFFGSDRDQGAVAAAVANARRAGVAGWCTFERRAVSEIVPPEGPPGLVMANPPYGTRIGNRKLLFGLYGALGAVLRERFAGWRVGIVTSDAGLAKATGLPFEPPGPPVPHGPLKVTLWRTGPL